MQKDRYFSENIVKFIPIDIATILILFFCIVMLTIGIKYPSLALLSDLYAAILLMIVLYVSFNVGNDFLEKQS
jgi:hypothetical protein